MPKVPVRDRSILYTVAVATAILIVGFASAWFYQKHSERMRSETVYSKPTRVVAGTPDYSVAASFAIQTSGDNAEWAREHQYALQVVAKQVLTGSDMRLALAPGGLQKLQQRLRDASNAALHTDKVQQIVITDFLVSSSSY